MGAFNTNIPIYLQIMQFIKQDIVLGKLHPGEKLASVREQSESLTVNPNTVQRAYQELEREGIIETKRGMGSFIIEDNNLLSRLKNNMAEELIANFIEGMTKLGFDPTELCHKIELFNKKGGN